jgi:hypothetical protein
VSFIAVIKLTPQFFGEAQPITPESVLLFHYIFELHSNKMAYLRYRPLFLVLLLNFFCNTNQTAFGEIFSPFIMVSFKLIRKSRLPLYFI